MPNSLPLSYTFAIPHLHLSHLSSLQNHIFCHYHHPLLLNIPPKPHLPEIETQNHHLEAANQNGQFDFIYFLISFGLVFDFELD